MKRITKENLHNEEIERVISIFKKAGIDCLPKVEIETEKQKTDIDVLAIYNNFFILVECAGEERFGPKLKKSLTDFDLNIEHFEKMLEVISKKYNDFYKEHERNFNSTNKIFKKLFVSLKKETKDCIDTFHHNMCKKKDACIWTMEEIYYYTTISDCTYDHCKYEIFECLNFKPEDVEDNTEPIIMPYLAYGKKINNKLYLLNFIVPVSVLLHRSTIKRLQDSVTEEGYQRLLDKNKLKRMRKYLLSEEKIPMYPNNIICVLSENASKPKEIGKTISDELQLEEEKAKILTLKKQLKNNIFLIELPN